MSFLNPVILFGLFAASFPILIHLFTRSKSRIIPFSTIDFLKEMQHQQIRRIRLRQILLLILRTLIIILLIMAFARPTVKGRLDVAAANAKTSMAIILDNSVSMALPRDRQTLFALAKIKAEEITSLLHAGDEAYLLTTTDTTARASRPYHDRDMLNRAIADIKLSYRMTDISSAVEFASRQLATSSNINKEIYLISDMQASGFPDSLTYVSDDVRLFGISLNAEPTANLSVEGVEFVSTLLQQGKVAQVAVTIANTGDRDMANSLVQLFVNEKPVAQLVVQVDAGAAKTQLFRFTPEKPGFSMARVVLEDDDLPYDNEKAFSFYVPEKVTVGLAGFQPRDTFYVSLVLEATGAGADYFSLQNIALENLRQVASSDLNVLVLSNIPTIDEYFASELREFIEDGGGLLLLLGKSIDLRSYNSALVGTLALPQFLDVIGSPEEGKSDFTLGQYDLTHPIFTGVFENQDALIAPPRFHFAIKIAGSADIDVIMKYSTGDPLLFEKKLGHGTILVMTTGFDVQLSDITHRTIFAPLVTRMVGYAANVGMQRQNTLAIGDEIRWKISPQNVHKTLEMVHPGAKYDRLRPTMVANDAWIRYSQTETPGIYELLADASILNLWTVHLDARESHAQPIEAKKLAEEFKIELVDESTPLGDYIVSRRHGHELWKYLAIAAFLLLLVEMFIFREKGRLLVENVDQAEL
ncbi:BatA domain-containing protein [candidate division KSB1 bacterium]|nr:BatA domain-containing protein [candidate division KSB1 bacterium]